MTLAFFRRSSSDVASGGPRKPRPRVGLVLGAGVARGWALIGALHELTEMGVVPDVVVGASIGAVVGGCYAAGRLAALEDFALSLTKRSVFNLIDFSFSGAGLMGGDRLRQRLEAAMGAQRIENLPVRFAAVATEMRTGHEVWLKQGPMVEAMRASYALPGIFEPVRIGGRWLFDGAIVNPVPVNVARALGADWVIALSIGGDVVSNGATIHDALPEEDLPIVSPPTSASAARRKGWWPRRAWSTDYSEAPGLAAVMVNTINITQDRIMRSRLAGDPPDLMVTMKTSKIGLFEFHRAAELIAIGRAAVRRSREDILEQLEMEPAAE